MANKHNETKDNYTNSDTPTNENNPYSSSNKGSYYLYNSEDLETTYKMFNEKKKILEKKLLNGIPKSDYEKVIFSNIDKGLELGFAQKLKDLNSEEYSNLWDKIDLNQNISMNSKLFTHKDALIQYAKDKGVLEELNNYSYACEFLAYFTFLDELTSIARNGIPQNNANTNLKKFVADLKQDTSGGKLNYLISKVIDIARSGSCKKKTFKDFKAYCWESLNNSATDAWKEHNSEIDKINKKISREVNSINKNREASEKITNRHIEKFKEEGKNIWDEGKNTEEEYTASLLEKIKEGDYPEISKKLLSLLYEYQQIYYNAKMIIYPITDDSSSDNNKNIIEEFPDITNPFEIVESPNYQWQILEDMVNNISNEDMDEVLYVGELSIEKLAKKYNLIEPIATLIAQKWILRQLEEGKFNDKSSIKLNTENISIARKKTGKGVVKLFEENINENLYLAELSKIIDKNDFSHAENNESQRLNIINQCLTDMASLEETNSKLKEANLRTLSPRYLSEMIKINCLTINSKLADKNISDNFKIDLEKAQKIEASIACASRDKIIDYKRKTITLSEIKSRLYNSFENGEKPLQSIRDSLKAEEYIKDVFGESIDKFIDKINPRTYWEINWFKDISDEVKKSVVENAIPKTTDDGQELTYFSNYLETQANYLNKYIYYILYSELEQFKEILVEICKNDFRETITKLMKNQFHPFYSLKSRVQAKLSFEKFDFYYVTDIVSSDQKKAFLTILSSELLFAGSFSDKATALFKAPNGEGINLSNLKDIYSKLTVEQIECIESLNIDDSFNNLSIDRERQTKIANIAFGTMFGKSAISPDEASRFLYDAVNGNVDFDRNDTLLFLANANSIIRKGHKAFSFVNKNKDILTIQRVDEILSYCRFTPLDIKHNSYDLLIAMLLETGENVILENALRTMLLDYTELASTNKPLIDQREEFKERRK